MRQTVTVEPSETYRWSFQHRGRNDTDTVEVFIDGRSQGTFSSSPGAWQRYSGSAVTTSNLMTFELRAVDEGSVGNLVDDVRIERANRLINGGFEQPTVSRGYCLDHSPGWTSNDGNIVEIWKSGLAGVPSVSGGQLAELNGTRPATVSQSAAVEPGATYRWSLRHRGRNDADTVEVLINGTSQGHYTSQPGSWQTYSGEVTADSAAMTLSLRAGDTGSVGNLIDQVELVRVD